MSKQLRVYREGAKTEFDYQILWEEDFTKLADAVKKLELSCGKICIVADDTVGNLYGKEVQKALEELDVTVDLYTFPAGEASKNLDTVKELYAFLIEHHYTRKDVLAALGGGVTGDLTGYAAATYLRGIDFIQIPTTLLAQVDSSVGGKTGVDFAQYKILQFFHCMTHCMSKIQQCTFSLFRRITFHDSSLDLAAFANHFYKNRIDSFLNLRHMINRPLIKSGITNQT